MSDHNMNFYFPQTNSFFVSEKVCDLLKDLIKVRNDNASNNNKESFEFKIYLALDSL